MQTGESDAVGRLLDAVGRLGRVLRRGKNRKGGVGPESPAVCAALRLLGQEPGLTVPQVARARGTSRQNIQVLVNRLAKAGLVRHLPNADHCRSGRLELTPAGRRWMGAARRDDGDHRTRILQRVSPEELEACAAVLRKVREVLCPGALDAQGRRARGRRRMLPPREEEPASNPVTPPVSGRVENEDTAPPESLPVSLL